MQGHPSTSHSAKQTANQIANHIVYPDNPKCNCRALMCQTCGRNAIKATAHLTFSKKVFDGFNPSEENNRDIGLLIKVLEKRFPDNDFCQDGSQILLAKMDRGSDKVIETYGCLTVANGLVFYEKGDIECPRFFFDNCHQDNNGVWYTGRPDIPVTLAPIVFQNWRLEINPLSFDFGIAFKYKAPTQVDEEAILKSIYQYLSPREISMIIERDFASQRCGYPVTPNPFYLTSAFELGHLLEQLGDSQPK